MFCPQCREELPDDAKYCVKCGYDFSKLMTPPARKHSSDSLDGLGTSLQKELDDERFKVGTLFANRYEILSEGQKGGMGVVYKCKDTMLNGKIKALKVIHPRLLSSVQAQSRFRQEVAISQELNHENIVRVYDIEEWAGKEYFTMEWVEGVSLREVITERKKENRPFSIEEASAIISQLSDALHHAHKLTIHRDIKPENILIANGKEQKVKLTDFGIAKMLSPSQFTSTSMQMGTPYYMAPEQKVNAANVDKRADIYALGVVLFELLTLENTIGFELPSEINKAIPPVIDNIIKKSVATKSDDRFGDAKEVSEALKKVADGFSENEERIWKEAEEQKRREEKLKRREGEMLAKEREESERKRIEEQSRKTVENERTKITETPGQRETLSFTRKIIAAIAVLAIVIGVYLYKSKKESSTGYGISSPPAESPAPYGYDMVPGKGWVPAAPTPTPAVETAEAEKKQRAAEEARREAERRAEEAKAAEQSMREELERVRRNAESLREKEQQAEAERQKREAKKETQAVRPSSEAVNVDYVARRLVTASFGEWTSKEYRTRDSSGVNYRFLAEPRHRFDQDCGQIWVRIWQDDLLIKDYLQMHCR